MSGLPVVHALHGLETVLPVVHALHGLESVLPVVHAEFVVHLCVVDILEFASLSAVWNGSNLVLLFPSEN